MRAHKHVDDFLLDSHRGLADLALWVARPSWRGEPAAVPSSRPSLQDPRMSDRLDIPGRPPAVGDGQGQLAPWASRTKRSLVDPVTTHMHVTAPVGEQPGTRPPWPRSPACPGAPSKQ
jgi:hypothetical protein